MVVSIKIWLVKFKLLQNTVIYGHDTFIKYFKHNLLSISHNFALEKSGEHYEIIYRVYLDKLVVGMILNAYLIGFSSIFFQKMSNNLPFNQPLTIKSN